MIGEVGMQEKSSHADEIKAGFFSLAVHAVLIALLFFSFNWKTAEVNPVAEVTLWESLPQAQPAPAEPPPILEEKTPEPEIKPEPEVKPEPPIKDDVAEQQEIALEKKRQETLEKKREEEKRKKLAEAEKKAKELEQKKILAALKNDISKAQPEEKTQPKVSNEALKKLQQEALAEENAQNAQQASAAAAKNAGEIDKYKIKIITKIRGNVNKTLCGSGSPELKFEIGLLPTGELSGTPKLTKSSGNEACDEAVERAILASEPLPVPTNASLFTEFRNLNLNFKPNE
jgi:colicin import membrane protein